MLLSLQIALTFRKKSVSIDPPFHLFGTRSFAKARLEPSIMPHGELMGATRAWR